MQLAVLRTSFSRRNAATTSRETSDFQEGGGQKSPAGRPRFFETLQALHFYGSAGIVAFGWALSRLLHFNCDRYLLLWLAGALCLYNLDRLKIDPADAINTPDRARRCAQLRKAGTVISIVSAGIILTLPVLLRDWPLFFLTLAGGFVCLNYSMPILGFRFKDLPLVKTLFPPTILTAAYFMPPIIEQQLSIGLILPAIAWAWCVLLFNMILCDLRDLEGDRATGIRTLPVLLGRPLTFLTLILLLAITGALAVSNGWVPAGLLYCGGLLVALRKPRCEAFYEWWVEGMLFIPVAVYALSPT
ncbi:MAG: UbiA family prenyltransferase [Verrucomicrobiota bacterium]